MRAMQNQAWSPGYGVSIHARSGRERATGSSGNEADPVEGLANIGDSRRSVGRDVAN